MLSEQASSKSTSECLHQKLPGNKIHIFWIIKHSPPYKFDSSTDRHCRHCIHTNSMDSNSISHGNGAHFYQYCPLECSVHEQIIDSTWKILHVYLQQSTWIHWPPVLHLWSPLTSGKSFVLAFMCFTLDQLSNFSVMNGLPRTSQ